MNKINRHLLQIFINSKYILKKTVFDGSDPKVKVTLLQETLELSKLLVLQDHSMQTVLMQQGEECNGLYILQKGTLSVHIIKQNSKMI